MNGRTGESGFTLTEMTVVIVLAAVVMTGLVVFYLNSQALWLEGSAQAVTQRELTLALHEIGQHARSAASAIPSGDAHLDRRIDFFNVNNDPDSTFGYWLADSTLHSGYPYASDATRHDLGPVMQSRVTVFAVGADSRIVSVDSLGALTPQGSALVVSTSVALMNRSIP